MNLSLFTNRYSMSKTLRFKLIPEGNTVNNLAADRILEEDRKRADEYGTVKQILDRYHKFYIEGKLSSFTFPNTTLEHYAECYQKKLSDELEKAQNAMMVSVSSWLRGVDSHGKCSKEYDRLYSKEMVTDILPEFVDDDTERELLRDFSKFWTYFSGYNQNRANMYTGEGKSTEIAYRIVMQNLPKFLDNLKVWETVQNRLPADIIGEVDAEMVGITGLTGREIFNLPSFNKFLSQTGIENFNRYIGGYANDDGSKIQGLNERINLYAQQTGERLPKIKPLFKQILSDRDSISFIPEMFTSDMQMLQAVGQFSSYADGALQAVHALMQGIGSYALDRIYVPGDTSLTTVSNALFDSWSVVKTGLERIYESEHPMPEGRSTEKYMKEKDAFLSPKKSWSLAVIEQAAWVVLPESERRCLTDSLTLRENDLYQSMNTAHAAVQGLLQTEYPESRAFAQSNDDIRLLKDYLDSIKDYQHFIGLFAGNGTEPDKDSLFYGIFEEQYAVLSGVNHLYDRVRNYVTKKPYSTDKIRMMFNRSDFLGGWAQPGEWGKQEAHLFEKNGKYYVFVTSRTLKRSEWRTPLFTKIDESSAVHFEYITQKIDPPNVPRMFIHSKGENPAPSVKECNLPIDDISELYQNGYFKVEYRKVNPALFRESLCKLIDYFKLGFSTYGVYKNFRFNWKPSSEYANISEFYHDTAQACYIIRKESINFNGLISMVDNGLGYLFEIYSKDFSPYSHGTPNLHTLYFKALFDESNEGRIRLQGGAQIYYRAPSLKLSDTTVHPANEPIANKNPLNPKRESTFPYDMVKNKRFTADHFELHIPVSLNATAYGYARLNDEVKASLAESDEQYIIGIDRGERNLLYISVIDSHARIVEQYSLNVIEDEYKDTVKRTDYHDLLDRKEHARLDARKEWKTIEGIKDVKEGYLSQAVHRICMLVERYSAIVVMENLNSGFKNTRSAVEKSVYQKFEKMLCDKLSYMTDKQKNPAEDGGVLNGYQLAEPTTSYTDMRGQNGIIFYVPAWLTSKIDPTTGFADMLHPKYESVESSKDFFGRFESITYAADERMFVFSADFSAFPKTDADYRKKWDIYTNGTRIRTFRNDSKNSQWDNEEVNLTAELVKLCEDYGIDYKCGDLKSAFVRQTEKAFFVRLTKLLNLTLQMRNSVTGTDIDYMISPVKNASGTFFDSRSSDSSLPADADANGAYNIARKGLWIVSRLKAADDTTKVSLAMTNAQWLEYAQTHFCDGSY